MPGFINGTYLTVNLLNWKCLLQLMIHIDWHNTWNTEYRFAPAQGRQRRGGGQWRHSPPENLHSWVIVPTNGNNVSVHNATKQGLYCSYRKPCKAFQSDCSYLDQRQSCRKPEIHSTNKMKMKCCTFLSLFRARLSSRRRQKTNVVFVKKKKLKINRNLEIWKFNKEDWTTVSLRIWCFLYRDPRVPHQFLSIWTSLPRNLNCSAVIAPAADSFPEPSSLPPIPQTKASG